MAKKIFSADQLFSAISKGDAPALAMVRGRDPYLESELYDLFKSKGIEVHAFDLNSSGPDAAVESAGLGMGLFSQSTIVWMKAKHSCSKWSKDALARWKNLNESADGHSLFLILQVPEDKRLKWDALKIQDQYNWFVEPQKMQTWVKRMAAKREWDLGAERLNFLLSLDMSLQDLDSAVELWFLGGDTWAQKGLGWGAKNSKLSLDPSQNAAFAWVDAVIEGKKQKATLLLRHLIKEDGAEPIQLAALLAKSTRLVALLQRGWNTKGYHEFMIRKWRNHTPSKERIDLLMKKLQNIDFAMKSSSFDGSAALESIV